MATQFVSGNRTFAQPEIDGGEFTVNNPVNNVLIVTRFRQTESILVMQVTSSGVLSSSGTNINGFPVFEPSWVRYNAGALGSSGASISSAFVAAGASYDWLAVGVGG